MSIEQSRESDSSSMEQQQLLEKVVSQIETKFEKLPPEELEHLSTLPVDDLKKIAMSINSRESSIDKPMNDLQSEKFTWFSRILTDDTIFSSSKKST